MNKATMAAGLVRGADVSPHPLIMVLEPGAVTTLKVGAEDGIHCILDQQEEVWGLAPWILRERDGSFERGIDPQEFMEDCDGVLKCKNRFKVYVWKEEKAEVFESLLHLSLEKISQLSMYTIYGNLCTFQAMQPPQVYNRMKQYIGNAVIENVREYESFMFVSG
jgi:hypothetical protein